MKFLADEHIDKAVIVALKNRLDIIGLDEIGKRSLDDKKILEIAKTDNRIVITMDSDFLRLHAAGARHKGILFLTKLLDVGDIIREIEKIAITYKSEDIENTVLYIPLK